MIDKTNYTDETSQGGMAMNTKERNDFLRERKTGIGGSDAAAVLGMNPYKTALQVYFEKISNDIEEQADNEPMYWGRALEEPILKRYQDDTNRKIVKKAMVRDPSQTYIIANLDATSYEMVNGLPTSVRVVEAKTSSRRKEWGEAGTNNVPVSYLLQVQHYMMVTGIKRADIPALFNGREFVIYTVDADEELHQMMRAKYAEFWEHVQRKTPPEAQTLNDLNMLYGAVSRQQTIEATQDVWEAFDELVKTRREIKALKSEIEDYEAVIKEYMKESDTLTFGDEILLTWKVAKARETIDTKRLKKEHPNIYAAFTKTGNPSRLFRIKGETND